jgi:hypothetical protein
MQAEEAADLAKYQDLIRPSSRLILTSSTEKAIERQFKKKRKLSLRIRNKGSSGEGSHLKGPIYAITLALINKQSQLSGQTSKAT